MAGHGVGPVNLESTLAFVAWATPALLDHPEKETVLHSFNKKVWAVGGPGEVAGS